MDNSSIDTATGSLGVTKSTDSDLCPTCGRSATQNSGLEQFLGKLGISDGMIRNLETQFQNVNIDEYLDTARAYLKDGGNKATVYAKENPGKVAAGVAALAVGAGLLYTTMKDK
jgi:hypothetical protein